MPFEFTWQCSMSDLHTISGHCMLSPGPNHICCDIGSGIFESVTGSLRVEADPDTMIFMNGYQTWTFCHEKHLFDRTRGLNGLPAAIIRKFSFDRYGDYHFTDYPYRKGIHQGLSWCTFRNGDRIRLFASLNEAPGYTLFRYDASSSLLTISRDCSGIRSTGSFPIFDLFYTEGSEDEVYDAWFREMNLRPRTAKPIIGYTSWYNRYEAISAHSIREDLAGCRTLLRSGDLFQIDDGWEPGVGDWLQADPVKFPDGLAPIVHEIHDSGFTAGIWLAPFVCRKDSAVYRDHPDWLLKINGDPWSCGCNWGGFYSLDIDHPGVRDYLTDVFHRVFEEWGFDLVKLDFLYGAAPFGSENESRAGRMIRAMEWLRELCGEHPILACGVPVMPTFGIVEYSRVSCDVSLDWNDKFYMRAMHRERTSTRNAIATATARRPLNRRAFINDPDVFFLRDTNLRLSSAQKHCLAEANARNGGVLMISDDPGKFTPEQRAEYERIRAIFDNAQ